MKTLEQYYQDHVLTDGQKLKREHNLNLETFEKLRTVGLSTKMQIDHKDYDPFLSTFLFDNGPQLDLLLSDPQTEESFRKLQPSLTSNIVLLGLNAGAMDNKITPAWHYFHKRFIPNKEGLQVTASERNLEQYLNTYHYPIAGAYMTDIIKFKENSMELYIEPNSIEVGGNSKEKKATKGRKKPSILKNDALLGQNFKILKRELKLLHTASSKDDSLLILPIGGAAFNLFRHFLKFQAEKADPHDSLDWIKVAPRSLIHYSSRVNHEDDKIKATITEVGEWLKEHID